jgi:cold shock CspA family protein
MATGAVKWFDQKKGYGFLTPDLGPRDVFVHVSALKRSGLEALPEGTRVEFELGQLADGRLAALALRPARPVLLAEAGAGAEAGDDAAAAGGGPANAGAPARMPEPAK